jgi:hypothetical protein
MMVEKVAVGNWRKSESSRNERDVIRLRAGEAVCSLHFVVSTLFKSVSGYTMTRDEAGAQDGAQNSVSNGAHLGPLEPK